jgi:AmmeMemoRadiSam system protein B/AmmeMemoRadiSam system protein A
MRTRNSAAILFILATFSVNLPTWSQTQTIDRQPVWAGQLYPGDAGELRSTIRDLSARGVPAKNIPGVIAIVVPHAGYVYSGGVAASGYNQIDTRRHYDNVFILGPSHSVGFEGAAVYADGNFLTPLGTVAVNTALGKQLAENKQLFSLRRDAHAQEHCIEVQLPFLQYRLGSNLRIVPIVLNASSPSTCKGIAEVLRPYFNLNNLFVISTDFSHYPPYDDAKKVDKRTADAIVSRSPDRLLAAMRENAQSNITDLATSLCGWPAVMTLLYLVEGNPNVQVQIIEYKNSGDAAVGQKNSVVGYHAMVVSLRGEQQKSGSGLSPQEKKDLLLLARKTIEQRIRRQIVTPPEEAALPKALTTNAGAFVTLRKNGELRGCIGRFDASEPLYKVVQQMAVSSSTEDYRFPPVNSDEIEKLEIEISVLTPMRRIKSIDEFELGKHGIYIRKGTRAGTFLPQVAEETGWTKEEFIGHCAQDKAGIGWDGWKDAELYVYEAMIFSEKELHLR